jgi:hypothetical protein
VVTVDTRGERGRRFVQALVFLAVLILLIMVVVVSFGVTGERNRITGETAAVLNTGTAAAGETSTLLAGLRGTAVAVLDQATAARRLEAEATATAVQRYGTTLAIATQSAAIGAPATATAEAQAGWIVAPVAMPTDRITVENAAGTGEVARWGMGRVYALALSPDGQLVAVATVVGVHLYDARTLQEVRLLPTLIPAESVAFSPDSQRIAAGFCQEWFETSCHSGQISFWDVATGRQLSVLAGTARVRNLAFSPDGRRIAAGGAAGGPVQVWDWLSGQELQTLGDWNRTPEGNVAFSPGWEWMAYPGPGNTAAGGGAVSLWGVQTGEVRVLLGPTGLVRCVAFSPSGDVLASGALDGTVLLWSVQAGQQLLRLEGPAQGVSSVAFSPDGTLLAVGSLEGPVQLWEVSSGRQVQVLSGHTGEVQCLAFSPDGAVLLSASQDGTARLWGQLPSEPLVRVHQGRRVLLGGKSGRRYK